VLARIEASRSDHLCGAAFWPDFRFRRDDDSGFPASPARASAGCAEAVVLKTLGAPGCAIVRTFSVEFSVLAAGRLGRRRLRQSGSRGACCANWTGRSKSKARHLDALAGTALLATARLDRQLPLILGLRRWKCLREE